MTTHELAAGTILPLSQGRVALRCRKGIVWATQEGDLRDYVLREGDARAFEGSGRVVVQAIEEAAVDISPLRGRRAG